MSSRSRWLLSILVLLALSAGYFFARPDAASPTSARPAQAAAPAPREAAQPAPATPAEAVAPKSHDIQLWAEPKDPSGSRLTAGAGAGHQPPRAGRSARIDPASLGALATLAEGTTIAMPAFGGEVLTGAVVRRQVEPSGLVLVGGQLTGGRTGTFAFSSGRAGLNGSIQLPVEGIALVLEQTASSGVPQVRLVEKPLAEVVCYPFPNFPDERSAAQDEAEGQPGTGTAPVAVPVLSSRPGATAVLYLDFDGEQVTDPHWNGGKLVDAKPANLTVAEITEIWQRISEDYLSFNVDITTDVRRYNEAPVGRRMRCIVTPTNTVAPGAGGVAYLNSFAQAGTTFSATIPCWVFNPGVIGVAEAASHEFGHTFGLRHDGRSSPGEEYFMGHGDGELSWAPIMGVGYYRKIVQWSRGEYAFANNPEDDVAVIASPLNGFGFSADEAGNGVADAAALSSDALGRLEGGGVVQSAADVDFYRFEAPPGRVRIDVQPGAHSPNVDVLLELRNATGDLLSGVNPADALAASLDYDLPGAGTYHLAVRGAGQGDPAIDGYSSYGSMGEYLLRGSIPVGDGAPFLEAGTAITLPRFIVANEPLFAANAPTSFVATGLPAGLSLAASTGVITGLPTAPAGSYTVTVTMTNAVGSRTGTFVLTLTTEPVPVVTMEPVTLAWRDRDASLGVTATALPQSYGASGLPAGLTIDPDTGIISGTPTVAGVFAVTVSATNATGTGSTGFSLAVVRPGLPVAVGNGYSLFVPDDGTLWVAGANGQGQLGDGSLETRTTPIPIASGVTGVAAGFSHSLFLRDDHSLWGMGANSAGQLGDGSGLYRTMPIQMDLDVMAVAAGSGHSLWLKFDGTLWATGRNDYGQLGNGTTVLAWSPVPVASGVTAIAAGGDSSFFIKADGSLWATGYNGSGQLGNGSHDQQLSPVKVADGVFSVTAGVSGTLFLKRDGSLWGMGANNTLQIGGTYSGDVTTPLKITDGVIGAATANQATYLLKSDHTLAMRGWDGITSQFALTTVASSVESVVGNSETVLFTSLDGRFWGVGGNSGGQFGDGFPLQRTLPLLIAGDVATAAAGAFQSLFIKTDGSLWACGGNYYGQLGDGTRVPRGTPFKQADEVRQAAAGSNFTFFVGTDDRLWFTGLVPGGPGTSELEPWLLDTSVQTAAAGGGFGLYLKNDSSLWTMGVNGSGQLGDGTTVSRANSLKIADAVTAIAAGQAHALFVKADGKLWAMGSNAGGRLGDGSTLDRATPVMVASDVGQVAAGVSHSLFLKTDGSLWGMGDNTWGQLGDGSTTNRVLPIPLAPNVVSFAAAGRASFYVRNDGTLWAAGEHYGPAPVRIARGVARVAAGDGHALVVKTDGTLWTLGDNSQGQLGDGRTLYYNQPVEIKLGPPAITALSVPFEVDMNGSVTFSVTATGSGLLQYQWRRNGVEIGGATGASYTVNNAQAQDGATYDVVVTGPAGTVTSPSGPLSVVGAKPAFTSPLEWSAPRLIPVTFRVTAANDVTTFAATGLPAGLSLNPASGLISGTSTAPAGDFAIALSATNAFGTTTAVLQLTLGNETAPVLGGGATVVGRKGMALSYAITGVPVPETFSATGLPAGLAIDSVSGVIAGTVADEPGIYPVTISGTNPFGTGTKVIHLAVVPEWKDRVVANDSESFFVDDDGTLWSAGWNLFGQLGDGTNVNSGTALKVATDVVSVFSSHTNTLFIKRDGSLWGMGWNIRGELGLAHNFTRLTPTRLREDVVGAAIGLNHSLYLKPDGSLWAVGANSYGQLGDGTTLDRLQPVLVANDVRAVAADEHQSLFIKTDDSLWGVGANYYGQLGDGTTESRSTPVPIASGVQAVAATQGASLFLKNDGSLWGMGWNGTDQLKERTGDDELIERSPVHLADGVVGMAAAPDQHLYLLSDGGLWGRGYNGWGQQGDQAYQHSLAPRQLATGITAFSTGRYHSVVRRADGTVASLGSSSAGELADGFDTEQPVPAKVAANVRQVAAGADQTLYVTEDSILWGMGYNGLGTLGDGTNIDRLFPVQVMPNVRAVAASYWHALVIKNDDSLWVVGNNGDGQLGLGTFNQNGIKELRPLDSNVSAAAAGMWHSLYLKKDGTVWGAGWNGDGQLGDGTSDQKTIPVQIMANVASISAGARHSMFLKNDGTLWMSGFNELGQLGDGTTIRRTAPVQVATDVAKIAAGGFHSLFLKTDGTLWGMGYGELGQLGESAIAYAQTVPVPLDTNVRSIAAGLKFSQYVKEDGTFWATGENASGNLGNGNATRPADETTPHGEQARAQSTLPMIGTSSRSLDDTVPTDLSLLSVRAYQTSVAAGGSSLAPRRGPQLLPPEEPRRAAGKAPTLQYRPVKIATGVAASSGGFYHGFYLRLDGTMWGMGATLNGRLGNGAGGVRWQPGPVEFGRPAIRSLSIPFAVAQGQPIDLAVTAFGAEPMTYQWRKNGVPIPGATTASFRVTTATASDGAVYDVVATNPIASVISTAVNLSVVDAKPAFADNLTFSLSRFGAGFHFRLAANNDVASYSATGLPAGLTIDPKTGVVSGLTSVPAGNYDVTAVATNANGSTTVQLTVVVTAQATPVLNGATALVVRRGQQAHYAIQAANLPESYAAENLPAGLVLDAETGIISGRVTAAPGRHLAAVSATNVSGTGSAAVTFHVLPESAGLAAARDHSLIVDEEGVLWATGGNAHGQLGDGTNTTRPAPVQIATEVVAASVSDFHSLFLKADGTLWSMGHGAFGQLGKGDTDNANSPKFVASHVRQVSAGYFQSAFVDWNDGAWATGRNHRGQIGDGTQIDRWEPVSIGSQVESVACGAYHTLLLMKDGTLRATGGNEVCQLGDGTTVDRATPVTIATGVTAIAATVDTSLFLKNDGTVWGCGDGAYGKLGDHYGINPTPVSFAADAVAIVASGADTCFIDSSGGLWALGLNGSGEIFSGSGPTPTRIRTGVAGVALGPNHSLIQDATGEVYSVGYAANGQLGDAAVLRRPLPVKLGLDISQVALGNYHTILLADDGALWGTGIYYNGERGPDAFSVRTSQVAGVAARAIAAQSDHTLFIDQDHVLWGMGYNQDGEIGGASIEAISSPHQVATDAVAVAAGPSHSLYVTADGSLWASGRNGSSQLGDGTTESRPVPVKVADQVAAVAAGLGHTLFLKTNGSLWGMGMNYHGELGIGNGATQASPVLIATGVTTMAAGDFHSLYVKNDGTLWGMGSNFEGQLGDRLPTNYFTPVQLASGVTMGSAGSVHSAYVKTDGTLWSMGTNPEGQLGDGTETTRRLPVLVATGVESAVAGQNRTFFIKRDHSLWGMGANGYGSLGIEVELIRREAYRIPLGAPVVGTLAIPVAANLGGTALMTVKVAGIGPFTYQWRKNGVPIAGATGEGYFIGTVTAASGGAYDVVVTGSRGSTTSPAGTLAVLNAPPVIDSPLSLGVAYAPVDYRITANNDAYQFSATGLPAGLTVNAATGRITGLPTAPAGQYAVTIAAANAYGTGQALLNLELTKEEQSAPGISSANTVDFGGSYTATAGPGFGALEWALGTGSTAAGAAIDASSGVVTTTGVGTVVIKVRFAGDATHNPSPYSADFTLTVSKVGQLAPTVSSATTFVFGGSYTATAGPGFGALEWTLGTGSTAAGAAVNASSGAVTTTGVGTVVIKARFAGDATHLASAYSADYTVTVAKQAQVAPTISSANAFVFGAGYTATANGGFGALDWTLGTGSTAAAAAINPATGAVTTTGVGTVVIKVRFAGDATHSASAYSGEFTVTVTKQSQSAPVISSDDSFTFGSAYTATASGGFGALEWALGTGSTAAGAGINATSGEVTTTGVGAVVIKVRFAGDATHAASAFSADFTITVGKLSQSPPVISSASSFVLGTAYTATASTGFGAVVWSLEPAGSTALAAAIGEVDGAVTCSSPGTVVIRAYFAGDATHHASQFSTPVPITVVAPSSAIRPATFNWQGYLAANPDVAAIIGSDADAAWSHYLNFGIAEGRTDGDFNVHAYLAQYPELAAIYGSDLKAAAVHWYTVGRQLGLRIPAGFDVTGYYARNLDIAGYFGADKYGAWLHYYHYGVWEGRSFDTNFIPAEYIELNADLKAVIDGDLQAATMHWLTYGHPVEDRMGRVPIGFNVENYFTRYPDLAAAFAGLTPVAVRNVEVWRHYLAYGALEGRSDGDFEANNYLATNPDLAAVFGTDVRGAALHWYFYGRREGRRIPAGFDVHNYRAIYPDLVVFTGDDLYGCWLHYRDVGVNEGRYFNNLFRPADYLALNPDVAAVLGPTNYRDALLHWLYFGQYEGRLGRY